MREMGKTAQRVWSARELSLILVPLFVALVLGTLDSGGIGSVSLGALPRGAVHYALILAIALLQMYAVRSLVRAISRILDEYMGLGRSRSLSTFTSVVLYSIVLLAAVHGIGQDLSGLLVGGALTGVVIGIAGQASLSNIIAGLVLLFARPYSAGMYVTVRAGTFGGVEYSGQVWDITLFYTTLRGLGGDVRVPNNSMIGAVVVVRPEEYNVLIPVTLPRTVDVDMVLSRLREGLPVARVQLDSVTEAGYIVSVQAFLPDEAGRRVVESAIGRLVREEEAAKEVTAAPPLS